MIKLAIDIGSSVTKIYRADSGNGIVLAEPSCVAVSGVDRKVKAIGKKAKDLIGKTSESTEIIFPVYEGRIVDTNLAAIMLREFLKLIEVNPISLGRSETVIALPCGARDNVKRSYGEVANRCGLRKIRFCEVPYLSALGSGVNLSESHPVFTLDIGGGTTNIAVLSSDGIIAGLSMNIGGINMDENIIYSIEQNKGLRLGRLTAERVKKNIGSLSAISSCSMVAEGIFVSAMHPGSVAVHSSDIEDCIKIYIDKILEYALLVLRKLPAEVAAEVNRNGIFLTGGVAKIANVSEYIGRRLNMQIKVSEEPRFAVVSGGGALIRNKKLLNKITEEYKL